MQQYFVKRGRVTLLPDLPSLSLLESHLFPLCPSLCSTHPLPGIEYRTLHTKGSILPLNYSYPLSHISAISSREAAHTGSECTKPGIQKDFVWFSKLWVLTILNSPAPLYTEPPPSKISPMFLSSDCLCVGLQCPVWESTAHRLTLQMFFSTCSP